KPRGTYIDAEFDEIKEEAKRTRRELNLLRRVVSSDDHISQMLTQFDSHRDISGGGGSGSDEGGDDKPGWDKDISGDEDADGDEDI
ncbi:hypothetical protein Tco_1098393, partial [Tanacetum coccineum]